MSFAHINGTEIYYEIHGNGQPVILLHGLGCNWSMFRYQIPYLEQKYMLIIPDLRGNGYSDRLNVRLSDILRIQCDDMASLIDKLQIDKAAVVGVSYGGVIAQMLALNYPDKVQSLVISDSFSDTKPRNFFQLFLKIITDMVWVFYLPRSLMVWFIRRRFRAWPAASEVLADMVSHLRRREIAMQRLALSRFDVTDCLPGIRVPVLGIAGNLIQTSVDLMMQVVSLIPGSDLAIINNSMDPSNLCQPDQFNTIIDSFLAKSISA